MPDDWMALFCDTLRRGSRRMGISLTETQVEQMACHAVELEKWNRHVNLTAIKGPVDLARKHFLDAIAVQPYLCNRTGQWLDMGTGGGFPGLPVKLLNPEIRMILMDASRKKVHFLKHVIRILKIDDIEAIHGRVEAYHDNPVFAGRFDGILARGLAGLDRLADLAIPLLSDAGSLYALKSPEAREEITDRLGKAFFIQWHDYRLPDGGETRSLVQLMPK